MAIRSTQQVRTAGGVIDALGGTTATAKLAGTSVQQISNARGCGRLPPSTFHILFEELKARGLTASPALWGMRLPRRRAARCTQEN